MSTSPSYNGSNGVTVRVRNVTSEQFEIRLHEWDCHNGTHAVENLGWVAVERGHFRLSDGTQIEASTRSSNVCGDADTWDEISFIGRFDDVPVLASTINTWNGGNAAGTWHNNVSRVGAQVSMVEDERDDGHTTETIGYVAIGTGSGTIGDVKWAAARTNREVNHEWFDFDFPENFDGAPALIVDFQSQYGGDSAQMRISGLNAAGFSTRIHESCTYGGSNGTHTTEVVGYMAFESGESIGGRVGGGGYTLEGNHVSEITDFGRRVIFGRSLIDVTLNQKQVGLIFEVSNDNFQTVEGQVAVTPNDGQAEYAATQNLPEARYLRVTTILRTDDPDVTPILHEYGLDVSTTETIDFSGASLINIGKINANIFDPVFKIGDEFHTTYLPESPQALVEVRGEAQLEGGVARIELSKAPHASPAWLFSQVADRPHAIVTPKGPATLYVESLTKDALVVRSHSGDPNVPFFFHLTGIRVDLSDRLDTHYSGDPNEISTAIDPKARKIWRRGQP